jgi:hypothetical protein
MNPQNDQQSKVKTQQITDSSGGFMQPAGDNAVQITSSGPVGLPQVAAETNAPTSSPIVPATKGSSAPMIADDSDLIEKEWVTRAKQIVEQTKADPYNQNREINRVKADYLKKRYDKDIKLEGE